MQCNTQSVTTQIGVYSLAGLQLSFSRHFLTQLTTKSHKEYYKVNAWAHIIVTLLYITEDTQLSYIQVVSMTIQRHLTGTIMSTNLQTQRYASLLDHGLLRASVYYVHLLHCTIIIIPVWTTSWPRSQWLCPDDPWQTSNNLLLATSTYKTHS